MSSDAEPLVTKAELDVSNIKVIGLSIGEEFLDDDARNKEPLAAVFVTGIPIDKVDFENGDTFPPGTIADLLYLKPGEDTPINNPYVSIGNLPRPNTFLSDVITNPVDLLGDGMRSFQMGFFLDKSFDTKARTEAIDIVKSSTSRRILLIAGHGGGNPLVLGEAYDARISAEKLLKQMNKVIDRSYAEQKPINERYSLIALEPCNRLKVELQPDLAKQIGVDIFYMKGVVSLNNVQEGITTSEHLKP